jgi:methylthioribose-1-phosphate isomerase
MDIIRAVDWSDDGAGVRIIDQRELPAREVVRDLRTLDEVCDAIRTLAVRGAPAFGIAGAMGLAVASDAQPSQNAHGWREQLRRAADAIRGTRPTAVNLAWALDRMLAATQNGTTDVSELRERLRAEASAILAEDRAMCRRIGELGATLIPDGARILTHCNTGALATGGMGTALAAIYVAVEQGKRVEVFADETRPLLQGSRLTAWELSRAGIPTTVLADGAAAALMRERGIDLCIVGADRIAANGDTANKVGTYSLAIVAARHDVPFCVAAPTSTFDPATPSGEQIHIEQRNADEVRCGFGRQTAPMDVDVYNPAFDVTPAELITAIVSDRAIHRAPFDFSSAATERPTTEAARR